MTGSSIDRFKITTKLGEGGKGMNSKGRSPSWS
jgi:hypothetical protein